MKDIKLSPRLYSAAGLVRKGSFIADVGTDHAYLPIFLANKGIIRGAVASDINQGPIERAAKNVASFGLDSVISVKLSDGLQGIDTFAPDDICILGMGGELISEIIKKADFTKNSSVRLILQPMTHPEILRKFLLENLYEITDEEVVLDDKIYQIIVASYSGRPQPEMSPAELLLGRINIEKRTDVFLSLCDHWTEVLEKRAEGRTKASLPPDEELSALIDEIRNLRKK